MDDHSAEKRGTDDESPSTSGVGRKKLCVDEIDDEDDHLFDNDDDCITFMAKDDLLKMIYQDLSPINWDLEKENSCDECKTELAKKEESTNTVNDLSVSVASKETNNSTEDGKMRCADKTQEDALDGLELLNAVEEIQKEDEIHFLVGKFKRKFIEDKKFLSLKTDVFKTMLNELWIEDNVIEIPDVDPDAFDSMLKFLKGKDIPTINRIEAANLCYVAEKYNVPDITKMVAEYLRPNTVDKMWIALRCGILYNLPEVEECAMKIIREDTSNVFRSPQFLTISRDTLIIILSEEYLDVESEVEVFNAAVCWAQSQCEAADIEQNKENMRQQLGEAIHHIRFLTLTPGEIESTCPLLLTPEEISKIMNVLQRTEDKSTIKPFSLCTEKRKKHTVEISSINFPLFCLKFFQTPLTPDLKKNTSNYTSLKLTSGIIIASVLVHAVQNSEKTGQAYFEDATVIFSDPVGDKTSCKRSRRLELGIGRYRGFVKYNEFFKVPLYSKTADKASLSPGIQGLLQTYDIEVIFNREKSEPNPPYVSAAWCIDVGLIKNGYVIGLEYYLPQLPLACEGIPRTKYIHL